MLFELLGHRKKTTRSLIIYLYKETKGTKKASDLLKSTTRDRSGLANFGPRTTSDLLLPVLCGLQAPNGVYVFKWFKKDQKKYIL